MGVRKIKNKKLMLLLVGIVLVVSFSGSVSAANHYVRQGATGSGTGNDWINAYTELPYHYYFDNYISDVIRGDTYYIADGSYPSYTVNNDVSGNSVITIKKAIESDHGTATGWQTEYGDGQAVFAQPFNIYNSYVVFDGVVGSGPDYTSYGFLIDVPNAIVCAGDGGTNTDYTIGRYSLMSIGYSWIPGYKDISVSHVAMIGCGAPVYSDQARLISAKGGSNTNISITHCYLADAANPILMRSWMNSTIAFNYFAGNVGGSGYYEHGQQISAADSSGIKLSNNVFKNSQTYIMGYHRGAAHGPWYVYNNLIIGGGVVGLWANADPGVEADRKNLLTGWQVWNNIYVNISIGGYGFYYDDNTDPAVYKRYMYNNLFYNVMGAAGVYLPTDGQVVSDYNYYNTVSHRTLSAHDIESTEAVALLFSDYTNYNLSLVVGSEAINNGIPATFFSTDFDGVSRPQGPGWDIGAYEYISTTSCSLADTNSNNIVEITELINYISQWKSGSVVIGDLITAIGEWKNGC